MNLTDAINTTVIMQPVRWWEHTCGDCGYHKKDSYEKSPRLCETFSERRACPDFVLKPKGASKDDLDGICTAQMSGCDVIRGGPDCEYQEKILTCPFCGDTDFDRYGLKLHLHRWCEKYSNITEDDR